MTTMPLTSAPPLLTPEVSLRRFALVWNAPHRLIDITTRFEPFVEGLRQVGADAVTLCPTGMEAGYPYPVRTFDSERALCEPGYWRELGCQAAVIITWHRMTPILQAIQAAGMRVLAIGESDGRVSPRLHAGPTFRFMTHQQATLLGRFGAAKYWLERFLFRASAEHRDLLANTAAADVLTFGASGAVAEYRALLHGLGAKHLTDRVAWLPYPIAESFCSRPVQIDRSNRIIAIGRWDAAQKNPGLLEATVRRLADLRTGAEVQIVGRDATKRFATLARTIPTVQLLEAQPRERVAGLMAQSRTLLMTSRWEGAPLVVAEMLALGGTVVGTPIPSLRFLAEDSRFGRLGTDHTARAVARALHAEIQTWERDDRSPLDIARHWRALHHPASVAARIIELLSEAERAS